MDDKTELIIDIIILRSNLYYIFFYNVIMQEF